MKALLINPQAGYCVFGLEETLSLTQKRAGGPPLGLVTVAAMLPRSWELRLVDVALRKVTEADWAWADIVMLSGNYLHREGLLDLIRESKARGKTVVVGGPFASSRPDEIMDTGADFMVVGEGEYVIPDMLEAIKNGEKGGVFTCDEKPDLTRSPIPRFDLLDRRYYQHGQIQTARGCPFNCEFCDIITIYGRTPRFKDPSQVTAELETLLRLGWRGVIFVADDNFIGNKAHARATLEAINDWQMRNGKPFSFFTQASVNLGQDLELIDLMTAANFGNVFVGVESPDEDVLKKTGKTQNVRHSLVESLDNMNKNGLTVIASFVIGFDGERPGTAERISALMERTSIPVALLGTLWALPNTALWTRLKREGRLVDSVPPPPDWLGGVFNFVPDRNESDIVDEYTRAWDLLFEPSRFLDRVFRYYMAMRPTRKAIAKETGGVDPTAAPLARRPFADELQDLRALFILCWSYGVRSPHRMKFWRQFFGILKNNRSRWRKYFMALAYGPDMFRIRETLIARRGASKAGPEPAKQLTAVALGD